MKTIMQKYEIIRLKIEGWSDNRISKHLVFPEIRFESTGNPIAVIWMNC